ncbi:hypothetical protein [Candidatus Nitrosocosmicus sp. R]
MYRYIDASDNSHLIKDEAYNRIKKNIDGFMARFSSSKDKELLFEMVSKVYYKRRKAIQTKSESDTELLLSTLMATLIEQNLEIKRLSNL